MSDAEKNNHPYGARPGRPFNRPISRVPFGSGLFGLAAARGRSRECCSNHRTRFIRTSVAGVAGAAEVSEPRVVRFCRLFGCPGFKDFKIELARQLIELARQLAVARALHDPGRGIGVRLEGGDPVDRICASATRALGDAARELDLEALEEAARLIASASRIAVCGLRGSAGALAGEPHNRLVRLGLSSAAYADGHMRRMSASVPQRGA